MSIPSAGDPVLSGKMMSPLRGEMAIRDSTLCCSHFFPDTVINTIPHSPCTMHSITAIISRTLWVQPIPNISLSSYFCSLGFGNASQLNYLKILCTCMFILSLQNDGLLASCFNMQTTLVNQAGIERLPIILASDSSRWLSRWGTWFILHSAEVAYWLAIRELITQGYLHVARDSLAT